MTNHPHDESLIRRQNQTERNTRQDDTQGRWDDDGGGGTPSPVHPTAQADRVRPARSRSALRRYRVLRP